MGEVDDLVIDGDVVVGAPIDVGVGGASDVFFGPSRFHVAVLKGEIYGLLELGIVILPWTKALGHLDRFFVGAVVEGARWLQVLVNQFGVLWGLLGILSKSFLEI